MIATLFIWYNTTHTGRCDTGAIYLSREYYLIIDKQEAFNHLKHLQFTSESGVPFRIDEPRHLSYRMVSGHISLFFDCHQHKMVHSLKFRIGFGFCLEFLLCASFEIRREMRKSIEFSKHSAKKQILARNLSQCVIDGNDNCRVCFATVHWPIFLIRFAIWKTM